MSEKQTTAKKKPGRKPKADKTAEADNRNGGAVGESGAPDNGSGGSGENTEQAAHAPDQNGDIPEQSEEGAAQAAPKAGGGGAAEEEKAPAAEGWAVARVLKITKPLMKGEDVKDLQDALIARGYHCGASGASGVYERNTAYAVRCFQAANRLIVDGRAGRFTVAALGGTWNG
ncbi:peptidoglycan-binding domain-containing protein [uncultured Alistipes sp.]|uniref:peptidoglycan-binding domain-containing protein n=1 Tax=uncultured Alistipes sp. TaxID=538949 RepID=UPI00321FF8E6